MERKKLVAIAAIAIILVNLAFVVILYLIVLWSVGVTNAVLEMVR